MAQDSKRGGFISLFGSKKKQEEDLEAEKESHQRLEARIREALILIDPPKIGLMFECEQQVVSTTEIQPITALAPISSEPEEVIDYSYLRPSTGPESQRRKYRPAFHTLEPLAASRAR